MIITTSRGRPFNVWMEFGTARSSSALSHYGEGLRTAVPGHRFQRSPRFVQRLGRVLHVLVAVMAVRMDLTHPGPVRSCAPPQWVCPVRGRVARALSNSGRSQSLRHQMQRRLYITEKGNNVASFRRSPLSAGTEQAYVSCGDSQAWFDLEPDSFKLPHSQRWQRSWHIPAD